MEWANQYKLSYETILSHIKCFSLVDPDCRGFLTVQQLKRHFQVSGNNVEEEYKKFRDRAVLMDPNNISMFEFVTYFVMYPN